MRILIAAIGKLKDDEERGIVARYKQRFEHTGRALGLGPLEIAEFSESRLASSEARKAEEAERLLQAGAAAAVRIALDQDGQRLTSKAFATFLAKHNDAGAKLAIFLIGGPDGHGAAARERADLCLSLGDLTLPHGLARVVLTEQLYRAATILAGHPYHRG